ncbi:hypothetical protein B296_00039672 [Ensete ventricosum]|uniref:Uncharacterized protein n=1 Tax=Ensete ventricosum TaxID=4639 RepID=A0A426Z2N3_ENSVE|nr:hypothetical protein B296_00039672 [Ensete ventricosum]
MGGDGGDGDVKSNYGNCLVDGCGRDGSKGSKITALIPNDRTPEELYGDLIFEGYQPLERCRGSSLLVVGHKAELKIDLALRGATWLSRTKLYWGPITSLSSLPPPSAKQFS